MEYRCQACGFRVYNLLYPFCESCKAKLAPEIAMSPEERTKHFVAQREEDAMKFRAQQQKERWENSNQSGGDGGFSIQGDCGDGGGGTE